MQDEVMVNSSPSNSMDKARTVAVARDTSTPAVPGDYHEFMGSESKQHVTYDNRMEALSNALGNKDSVKV